MYYLVFRLFPKKHFSRLMGKFASIKWPGWMLNPAIKMYIAAFRIDMTQFAEPEGGRYPNFNTFFTRAVKPGARPVDADPASLVSPVDGAVVEGGAIHQSRLLQAKGREFSLPQLLGGIPGWEAYNGGQFVTIYLSPRDYHRIHTPCQGKVVRFSYIPGDLWTVSPAGVNGVPDLFARNERLISFLQTDFGEVAVVKVGATVVGKIKVVYHDVTSNLPGARAMHQQMTGPHSLDKGAELGRFELGSTVILLTRPGEATLKDWTPGEVLQMGQPIGRITKKTGKKTSR